AGSAGPALDVGGTARGPGGRPRRRRHRGRRGISGTHRWRGAARGQDRRRCGGRGRRLAGGGLRRRVFHVVVATGDQQDGEGEAGEGRAHPWIRVGEGAAVRDRGRAPTVHARPRLPVTRAPLSPRESGCRVRAAQREFRRCRSTPMLATAMPAAITMVPTSTTPARPATTLQRPQPRSTGNRTHPPRPAPRPLAPTLRTA